MTHMPLTASQAEAVKLKRPNRRKPCCIASDDMLGMPLLPLRACSPKNLLCHSVPCPIKVGHGTQETCLDKLSLRCLCCSQSLWNCPYPIFVRGTVNAAVIPYCQPGSAVILPGLCWQAVVCSGRLAHNSCMQRWCSHDSRLSP